MKQIANNTMKVIVLIVIAVVFGATLVALSVKDKKHEYSFDNFSKDDKKIEKTFPVKEGDKLVMRADFGNVSIVGSDTKELSVLVKFRGNKRNIEKYDVEFSQDGDVVTIEGKSERSFGHFFSDGSLDVNYEIQLPSKFNLDLHTSGGNVDIQNVTGEIEGGTSGGNVEVALLDGTIRLTTSGGNIDISDVKGDLDFRTSGGDIIAEGVNGTIEVETSGGNISFKDSDAKLDATTSGGNIRVSMKDNKGIYLSTSGGNIDIKLPSAITADVEASTSSGDVDCELDFSGKIKDGRMRGTINGGGNLIRATTSGGDISIDSLLE